MMKQAKGNIQVEISITQTPLGVLEAAYVRLSEGPVAETREVLADALLADYESGGRLVGIEILSPVPFAAIEGLLGPDVRKAVRRGLPPALLRGAA